nr:ATP-binding protein [Raineyella fluvialis]
MNAYLVAVGGLVVGVLIGVAMMALRARADRLREERVRAEMAARVTVRPEVSRVLNVLRSGAMVVGPHDEVLQSTAQARTLGVVRGARVVVPAVLTLVRAVRQDRQPRSTELDLKREGLTSLHVMARVAPLDDRTMLVLVEDRTAARRVDETRRDFVANVSHELKTPIGAVTLLAETLEDAADSPDDVRRFARRLQIEGGRLSDLVRQIIDLSRLQSDDPLLDLNEVLVDDVITDAVDRNRVDADDRHVTLTVAGRSDLEVFGDQEQLTIAVCNLIENAIMYSERGARVAVAARAVAVGEEDFVEISVSDNGIGIPEDEVQRIFERFYRVDYARSRDNGGTGLGLSIVKHIAAAHGGYVHVWSKLGQGSTFTIRIPRHHEREAVDGPSAADQATTHSQEVDG